MKTFMSGGGKYEETSFRAINPVPLTQQILDKLNIDDYVWLEKTDGVRKTLKINGTVIDTEYYDDQYWVFDCYS